MAKFELSINLYDKLEKAKIDAAVVGRPVGDEAVRDFLSRNIRVDITMHDAALRDLAKEAGLGKKTAISPTAAMFNEAVRKLNLGKGKSGKRFVQWLLQYAFDERLSFLRLLAYRPSLIGKARSMLADYNPDAATMFDEWTRLGFALRRKVEGAGWKSVSFEQFAEYHAECRLKRQPARTTRTKLLKIGLDPDIPLAAYDVLFEQSYHWNLSGQQRHKLAVARENGDDTTIARLTQRSRGNSEAVIAQVANLMAGMIEGAHVPAITVAPDKP